MRNVCVRCGHEWETGEEPASRCAKCKSPNYDQPAGQLIKPLVRARVSVWAGPVSRTKGGKFKN